MSILNCTVVSVAWNKTLYPWTMKPIGASGITVSQFYEETILGEVAKAHDNILTLDSGFLGSSKEKLDAIDLSIPLDLAVQMFGCFLSYKVLNEPIGSPIQVRSSAVDPSCPLCSSKTPTINHILNFCPTALNQGRLTWRHDSVLSKLVGSWTNI